jgi:hypothetical protein
MPEIAALQTEMALSEVSWEGQLFLNFTGGDFDVKWNMDSR